MTYRTSMTAAVFCVAALLSPALASAQQCQNGQCRMNHSRPSLTNTYQTPRLRPTLNRRSDSSAACADGQCELHSACRACGCDDHAGNCNCGPNCPPHSATGTHSGRNSELVAPRPTLDPRERPDVADRRTNGAYRPVSYSNTIRWEEDIRAAAARSRATGQPMLIQVTATWCGYCQQMKRDTYTNAGIIAAINRNFVAVRLDADANREIVGRMKIESLPTTLIVLPNLEVVERLEGFQSAAQLQTAIHRHTQRARLDLTGGIATR